MAIPGSSCNCVVWLQPKGAKSIAFATRISSACYWKGRRQQRMVERQNFGKSKYQSNWIFKLLNFKTYTFFLNHLFQVGFFPKEYVREFQQTSEELWCYNYMVIFPTGKSHLNDTNNNSNKTTPESTVTPRSGSMSSSSSNRSISSIAHGSRSND